MTDDRRDSEAVLLCGGGSRRLGFPKEMLRVDGAPLAVKMAARLSELFDKVTVVTNRPAYLQWTLDVPVIEDEFPGAGPLAGIHAGLKGAASERCFFLAVDMPLAHNALIREFIARAAAGDAPVVARADGVEQPLFGLYPRAVLGELERTLSDGAAPSARSFLARTGAQFIDFTGDDARALRDIDAPADLPLLREVFKDVEPLPVARVEMTRVGGEPAAGDVIAQEWPLGVHINGRKLATIMCLPTAARELVLGFTRYLGLVDDLSPVRSVAVDYPARRADLDIDTTDRRIDNAVELLVTSTCGANIYGNALPRLDRIEGSTDVRISRTHILECIKNLRAMAPVFEKTGCTHQAAFSDGRRVRYFFEDVGRHNAIDKITGAAMIDGADLSRGALITTGRLNSEMVIKALRARVPVLASRGAATSNAVTLAASYGLTLAGFARGGRVNAYTVSRRIADE